MKWDAPSATAPAGVIITEWDMPLQEYWWAV
jgi:hypothetical protein